MIYIVHYPQPSFPDSKTNLIHLPGKETWAISKSSLQAKWINYSDPETCGSGGASRFWRTT